MSFSASGVVPFTQAHANLSELADQVEAGAEKIVTKSGESYVALIAAGRTFEADGAIDKIQQGRTASAKATSRANSGKFAAKKRG